VIWTCTLDPSIINSYYSFWRVYFAERKVRKSGVEPKGCSLSIYRGELAASVYLVAGSIVSLWMVRTVVSSTTMAKTPNDENITLSEDRGE
jgi:hypothetical protein